MVDKGWEERGRERKDRKRQDRVVKLKEEGLPIMEAFNTRQHYPLSNKSFIN